MVSETPFASFLATRPSPPHLSNSMSTKSKRIFSDVVGDIVIDVDGQSFLLHKFPLVSRSGKIRRMVSELPESDLCNLQLFDVPGGPEAFELAAKFCYGAVPDITADNVAHLRCVAEFLEMTEDCWGENLISRTDAYLNEVVPQSVEQSVRILRACETMMPFAENVGIVDRCVDSIALQASSEQLAAGLARLDCDFDDSRKPAMEFLDHHHGWVDDLSLLGIDMYARVVLAMRRAGVRSSTICSSLIHYAQSSLKTIGTTHNHLQQVDPLCGSLLGDEQRRKVVEVLVDLLAMENRGDSIPLTFLFGMLRMATIVDASVPCRCELERKIGLQLEMATLDDLLIPSMKMGESLFDVDAVFRIVESFLQRIEEGGGGGGGSEEPFHNEYESDPSGSPSHSSVLKVGRLVDGYLAEIATDPNLKLHKFVTMIELLPEYARVIDDGLYRAIDIYLKAHPTLTEPECRNLCKLIDCQKLSEEASSHAAQNDRLPVQMAVRVLYLEQLRLKSSMSTSSGDGFFSQRMAMFSSSGVPSAAVSPGDNYACLRRENRELRLEISRMRARLSELEKEQEVMKEGMVARDGKSVDHGRAFVAALYRGLGRIGLFVPGVGHHHHHKCAGRKPQVSEVKKRRQQRPLS